jgi:hypothetical protein
MARRKPTVTARRQDGHHGARVGICRELIPGDFGSAVPVEGFRKCGGFTVQELDDACAWWLDRYTEAYPGETFAYLSPVNGRVTRSRINLPFTPVPLPESSAEYEAECARRHAQWDDSDAPEYRRTAEEREMWAEYERVMERYREVMGKAG